MAINNNVRMQQLRGSYNSFDKTKALPGEFQVVISDDPSVPSGKTVYIAFAAGDVKRLISIEDVEALIATGRFKGDKGDKGDTGPKGNDGTVSFDNLTDTQRASLKGENGVGIASIVKKNTGNGLKITFNSNSKTESSSFDYIQIFYDDNGTVKALDKIGGDIGNKTVFIPSLRFWLYWHTDSSNDSFYGFKIDSIEQVTVDKDTVNSTTASLPGYSYEIVQGNAYPESEHGNYGHNINKLWLYSIGGITYTINLTDGNSYDFFASDGPQGVKGNTGAKGNTGDKGDKGTTFMPSVDASGNLSWSNADGLDNPETVNIKGDKGNAGEQGPKGDTGVGVKKITDYYALSSSNTDKALGQVWLTTPPVMTAEKKYLWHWQKTDYTDDSSYSTEKGVIGVYGEQGPKGDKGPKGDNMSDEQAAQIEQNKTDIDSLKESISNKITKFYASNQGETYLQDSDDGKIVDMMVYGRSEQKQYSGKNLLNPTFKTATYSGVTLTNNGDGTYTIEGTNNSSDELIFPLVPTVDEQKTLYNSLIGKKVKFITESGSTISGSLGRICFAFHNETEKKYSNETYNGGDVTVPTGYDLSVVDIHINIGQTVPKTIIKPMITTDLTATYDDFEPYTGGIPSPNPSYPQEILAVKNPTVKVCGKNLLKSTLPTTIQNGIACTANGDGTYILNGTANKLVDIALTDKFHIENGKTYKITGWVKNVSGFIYLINGKDDARDVGDGATFTYLGESITKKVIHIQIPEGAVVNNAIIKPMISYDVADTYDDFEPYHEQTVTLPYTLNAIPVSSGGNVTIDDQEYVSDYFDVERGKIVELVDPSKLDNTQSIVDKTEWLLAEPREIDLTSEEVQVLKALATHYHVTNISITSDQLDGHTTFDYPLSFEDKWNDIKQQISSIKEDYQLKGDYPTKEETKEIIKAQTNHITFRINSEDKGLDLIYTE